MIDDDGGDGDYDDDDDDDGDDGHGADDLHVGLVNGDGGDDDDR